VALVIGSLSLTGVRERLTGVTRCEVFDGLDIGPVDGGDVAEVRNARVVVGQDLRWRRFDLGVPADLTADDGPQALVEAAIA
jgi:hypothetical protein